MGSGIYVSSFTWRFGHWNGLLDSQLGRVTNHFSKVVNGDWWMPCLGRRIGRRIGGRLVLVVCEGLREGC